MITDRERRMILAAINEDRRVIFSPAHLITAEQAYDDIEAVRSMDNIPEWIRGLLVSVHNSAVKTEGVYYNPDVPHFDGD